MADLTLALLTTPHLSIHLAVRDGRRVAGALSIEADGIEWESSDGTTVSVTWAELADALSARSETRATPAKAASAPPAAPKPLAARPAPAKKAAKPAKKATKKATKKAIKAPAKSAAADPATIRAWARSRGMAVSERGRLSADLVAAYNARNR